MLRIILALSLLSVSFAFAEDPVRGRLPDGRAFRTDGGGNQIVDYIAELELTVEQLNRRVHGLEDEVAEKATLVERLSSGRTPAPLHEQTIPVAHTESSVVAVAACHECPAVPECPKAVAPVCPKPVAAECPERVQAAHCAADLQKTGVTVQTLSDELSRTQMRANQLTEDLVAVQATHEAALRASTEREKALQVKLTETARALQSASSDRAMFSPEKLSPIENLRAVVGAELGKSRGLVAQRTQIYGEYYSRGTPAVRIDMTQPLSARGRSLDTLEKLLSNAQTTSQCTLVQKEVREINRKVNEDIALLRRLMR